MTNNIIAAWIFLLYVIDNSSCLQCWKCIQRDCDSDPSVNYKALKETCGEGASCMKVRYQMFDNVTHYDATTRACSSGECVPTSEKDYERCLETDRKYMVSGCALRKCCSDKDLCNIGGKIEISNCMFILTGVLLYISVIS